MIVCNFFVYLYLYLPFDTVILEQTNLQGLSMKQMRFSFITKLIILLICFVYGQIAYADNNTDDATNSGNLYRSPFGPYELNYVLPFYTESSNTNYDEIFKGEANKNIELKFQISGQSTFIKRFFFKPLSLRFFYTQLSYWQAYANSAYFRESNYNPGVFFHFQPTAGKMPFKLDSIDLGAMHQSNGRGNDYERSWNRAYFNLHFLFNPDWSMTIRPWYRIRLPQERDYNPDINRYLGDGDLRLTYMHGNYMVSLLLRNEFESGFKRGAEELDVAFPFYNTFHGFVQLFSGYGQSLISYNHYMNSIGVGISLYADHAPVA